MKMFEQTVESELEDSSGEHETATERYSRARRADVVRWRRSRRHTIEMQIFRAQNGDKKLQSCSERYGEAQALAKVIAKSQCEWRKHFAPLPGRPEDQVWLPENTVEHTRPDVWPPSSPNCSSLVYFVRGARGQETNKSNCSNEDDLRVRVIMTLRAFYGTW